MTSSAVLDPPGPAEPPGSFDERLERLAVVAGQVNVLQAEMVELVAATTDTDVAAGGYRSRGHVAAHRLGLSAGRARAMAASESGWPSCRCVRGRSGRVGCRWIRWT